MAMSGKRGKGVPCSGSAGTGGSSGASGAAAEKANGFAAPKYQCKSCLEPTTLEASRPASNRNLSVRQDNVCGTNIRNMQRRVKDRPATDALKVWWTNLIKDNAQFAAWLRKQKSRGPHERVTDAEHFSFQAEVTREVNEERERESYYGYDTLEFENPTMDEAALLALWRRRVASAPSKIERNGQLLLERPREVIIDRLRSQVQECQVGSRQRIHNQQELAEAKQKHGAALRRFARQVEACLSSRKVNIPPEAEDVDTITGNISRKVEATFSECPFEEALRKDFIASAQEQTRLDEEMMRDFEVMEKVKQAEVLSEEDVRAKLRRRMTSLESQLMERAAKLDASVLYLSQELEVPAPDLSHILADGNGHSLPEVSPGSRVGMGDVQRGCGELESPVCEPTGEIEGAR